jgi:photosystem II stability/assembly factor-like uncharacterized protein
MRALLALVVLLAAGAAGLLALTGDGRELSALCAGLKEARATGELSPELRREVVAERIRESEGTKADREPCGYLEEAALSEPLDNALSKQLFGSDTTPTEGIARARAQAAKLGTTDQGRTWVPKGPYNIGGRVLDVVPDVDDPDTLYVATASGGVWVARDLDRPNGEPETYEPLWPDDATQAIGALAQSPDGTLWAGTGEAGPGGGSITYGGDGVYRSDDRGRSWKRVGLEKTSRIGRIVVDPANPKRVFVAAIGGLYGPSDDRGLYVTENGGKDWKRVLDGDNDMTGVADVQFDPTDPKVVYATTWQNQREPDRRAYTGVGSGLYKSNDGGLTWSRIGLGTFGPSPLLGRLGVTVGPDRRVWVIATGESGLYQGAWVSADQGTTFQPRLDANGLATSGQFVYGWWFGRIWVDPKDGNKVYVAGVNLTYSTDGGQTWRVDSRNHADHHALVWDDRVPGRVINANDGGVYVSNDRMATWLPKAQVQPWTQLYSFDVSAQDPEKRVASLQDNGDLRSFDNGGEVGDWNEYHGGDGTRSLINPEDDTTYYGCHQYGACEGNQNGSQFSFGGDATQLSTNVVPGARFNYTAPLEFEPGNPGTLYMGGELLSKSTDGGRRWTPISPDLSNGPGRELNPLFKNFGTITTISPGPGGKPLYAGTDDGNVWANATGTIDGWKKAADTDLPKAWVTRVEQDPADGRTVYATFSGFRSGDKAAYVVRSTDGGVTWDDITGDLPEAPVNDINIDGDRLVVASDLGVFASDDDGASWKRVGKGLPAAPVYDLKLAEDGGLWAATFGRGMYRIDR